MRPPDAEFTVPIDINEFADETQSLLDLHDSLNTERILFMNLYRRIATEAKDLLWEEVRKREMRDTPRVETPEFAGLNWAGSGIGSPIGGGGPLGVTLATDKFIETPSWTISGDTFHISAGGVIETADGKIVNIPPQVIYLPSTPRPLKIIILRDGRAEVALIASPSALVLTEVK